MNLAEVIAANPEAEPVRNQRVLFEGRERVMLVALDRTAVLVVDGERRLVALDRIDIRDPNALNWQPREQTPRFIKRQGLGPVKSKPSGTKVHDGEHL
jgi:hypothetical protein